MKTLTQNKKYPDWFEDYEVPVRDRLLALRAMILDVAADTPGVGAIEEALKWGQPSFITSETGAGTTIRIDAIKDRPGDVALYVHCQTQLLDEFRQHYDGHLDLQGNRAILLPGTAPLPEMPLRHCIALALTYHQRRRRSA